MEQQIISEYDFMLLGIVSTFLERYAHVNGLDTVLIYTLERTCSSYHRRNGATVTPQSTSFTSIVNIRSYATDCCTRK